MKKIYTLCLFFVATILTYAQEIPFIKQAETADFNIENTSILNNLENNLINLDLPNTVNSITLPTKSLKAGYPVSANTQDSLALVALYNSTNGAGWINNTGWLTDSVYKWYGVTVDINGRITNLNLSNNLLTGAIPAEIGSLINLQSLALSYNQLSGTIPIEIGNLTNLTSLYLHNNQLSGNIPAEIGNLINLKFLALAYNQLSGNIPTEIGNLTNLTLIYLPNNQLSGNIPTEIGNLTNLTSLYLHNNQLSGNIPAEIGNLINLHMVALLNNKLTGTVPSEIGNLNNLEYLYLNFNQLSGSIPSEAGNLTYLRYLNIGENQLDGLPDLSTLSNLENCYIGRNNFDFGDLEDAQISASETYVYSPQAQISAIRDESNAPNITFTALTGGTGNNYQWYNLDNPLTGETTNTLSSNTNGDYYCKITNPNFPDLTLSTIPESIGNSSLTNGILTSEYDALIELYDSTNGNNWNNNTNWKTAEPVTKWYGIIAEGIHVIDILLYNNTLKGIIPKSIGNLNYTKELYLSKNELRETIPEEIGNLTELSILSFSSNQLKGSIPNKIGNLTNLTVLYLHDNQLTGAIPSEIGNLTKLESLSIGQNMLSGSLPSELGNLTNLITLYLYDNQLSGAIPLEIGNLRNLTRLYLSQNQLSSNIPSEIGNLSNLEILFLSENQFTGTIPSKIGSLTNLRSMHINDNQFDELPDLSQLSNLYYFNARNNYFTFEDIEPNINLNYFLYSPQAKLGETQNFYPLAGETLSLSINVGGSANTYQWYKNEVILTGAINSTYTISSFNPETDTGTYICKINNTIATALTLETENYKVSASFSISTIKSPDNGGVVSGSGIYKKEETASLKASANSGYEFVNWVENGIEVSTDTVYNFIVTKNRTLTANFRKKSIYNIKVTVNPENGGTVSGAGNYEEGSTASLKAVANSGYKFVNWTESGTETSTDTIYSFIVNADKTLVANFTATTGIDNISKRNTYIYPNPTTGIIFIKSSPQVKTIRIFNLKGALIFNEVFKEQINLSGLNEGAYLLKLYTENNNVFSIHKIIISK